MTETKKPGATQNSADASAVTEIPDAELDKAVGGAAYLKIEAIDGESVLVNPTKRIGAITDGTSNT